MIFRDRIFSTASELRSQYCLSNLYDWQLEFVNDVTRKFSELANCDRTMELSADFEPPFELDEFNDLGSLPGWHPIETALHSLGFSTRFDTVDREINGLYQQKINKITVFIAHVNENISYQPMSI